MKMHFTSGGANKAGRTVAFVSRGILCATVGKENGKNCQKQQ